MISVAEDVSLQQKMLPKKWQVGQFVTPKYGHMDFVWDRNARHMTDMVNVMFRYANGTF